MPNKDVTDIVLDKLDKLDTRLNSIDVTLAKNTESLEYHIKRTDLLEKQIAPVVKHVNHVEGILRFFGLVGVVAAILRACFEIYKGL